MWRMWGRYFRTAVCVAGCLVASTAFGQETSSGLTGMIRDASGRPVPGVTVEVASPALVEGSRAVQAGDDGQYRVIDLPPGSYSVIFRVAGFSTLRNDAVELPAGVTGTLNATLSAGEPSETIARAEGAARIDTRGTAQQNVVTSDAATSGRDATATVTVTRGLSQATTDVGGAAGAWFAQGGNLTVRGKAGVKRLFDGLRVDNAEGIGTSSYFINSAAVDRVVVETGGGNADSPSAGGAINNVPKSGANRFSFRFSGLLSTEEMQGDNFDEELGARGLVGVNKVGNIYDVTATAGGPIKKDRLWFFVAPKWWGNRNYAAGIYWNQTQGTPRYTPDLTRRADQLEEVRSTPIRLTWQASRADNVNVFVDFPQAACNCRQLPTTTAPEAVFGWVWGRKGHLWQTGLFQSTWRSTRASKWVMEAGWSFALGGWSMVYQPGVTPDHISITDIGLGFTWNDRGGTHRGLASNPVNVSDRMSERFATSYTTGSHAFRFGVSAEHVWHESFNYVNQDVNYTFLNGTPVSITEFATPFTDLSRVNAELSIFAQDQWTLRRLTLNYGVRYSYFNAGVPPQQSPSTRFVPFVRTFDAVPCVPCWHDIDPRVGAAYDLRGDGRTALKASFGRYVNQQVIQIANANNPFNTSVSSVTRTWNDADNDFTPDCDLTNQGVNGECGPISNAQFGLANAKATRYADDVIRGVGNRDYIWDSSIEIQHQITRAVGLTAGYYRNWGANFTTTRNQSVEAGDFSPFCVTAPVDSRLPGGGGYEVCGMYDISPAKFGQEQNLITQSSRFGAQSLANDFLGLSVNAQAPRGIRFGGNIETGRTRSDNCFIVNSPQELTVNTTYNSSLLGVGTVNAANPTYCRSEVPFAGNLQIKLNGTYPIGRGFSMSGNYQNMSGAMILSVWNAPNSAVVPSLGRNLAACGAQTNCRATVAIPLIEPGTMYEKRRNQLDLRLDKSLQFAGGVRLTGTIAVYNLLNSNAISTIQTTYGAQWLKPTTVLYARLGQVSARLDF